MKIQLEHFVYLKNAEEPIENRRTEGAVKFTGKKFNSRYEMEKLYTDSG